MLKFNQLNISILKKIILEIYEHIIEKRSRIFPAHQEYILNKIY